MLVPAASHQRIFHQLPEFAILQLLLDISLQALEVLDKVSDPLSNLGIEVRIFGVQWLLVKVAMFNKQRVSNVQGVALIGG